WHSRRCGYWSLHRSRPGPHADRFENAGREILLDSFMPVTRLAHVVALYEFDHELRTRLSDFISMVETSFRFHIGHRLGRADRFAHRRPDDLGALRSADPSESPAPTTAYREWLEEYDRHEKRARGEYVVQSRETYGPHLPIGVAAEATSFVVPSGAYGLT